MPTGSLTSPPYATPAVGFRSRKAAQLCAFFAVRAGGWVEKLKLIKLVYLTERQHLADFEDSMLLDELYSLPHGPICSATLNAVNGVIHEEIWRDFVVPHGRDCVYAKKTFNRDELDDLSDAEWEIAENIWSQFKQMSASQIRNYTHDHCPEYTETTGRIPISYREVLEAVGSNAALDIDREISYTRKAESELG